MAFAETLCLSLTPTCAHFHVTLSAQVDLHTDPCRRWVCFNVRQTLLKFKRTTYLQLPGSKKHLHMIWWTRISSTRLN